MAEAIKANTSKGLAVRQHGQVAMPMSSMADMAELGEALAKSGMFGVTNASQGMVLAATCHCRQIDPLAFIQTYHIIEGRPAMRADAMLAKFQERGGSYKVIEMSAKRAAARFMCRENDLEMELTMEQAVAAEWPKDKNGGIKKNWRCTPDAMLWSRLVSKAVRLLDPGVCAGVYTPEEVADFDRSEPAPREEKVVTPPAMKPAAKAAAQTVAAEVVVEAEAATATPEPEQRQAAQTVAKKTPFEKAKEAKAAEVGYPDVNVCPTGPETTRGKRWDTMPTAWLEAVLAKVVPGVTAEHHAVIKAVLAERAAQVPVEAQAE
jgi:hypothetical protein